MKILHIVTAFPISYPGGVTIYARTLANSQVLEGYDVHVLSRPESNPKLLPGITLHPYSPSNVIAFSPKNTFADDSANKVRNLVEREAFDIVHFHLSLDLPLDFMKSFYRMGTPYVVSLHDYSYICPRITMIDEKGAVCRSVDLAKCRSCIGALDQINLLRRISRRAHVRLPRIPSSAAERRMGIMRIFLNEASALLAVSNRTAEIYKEIVPEARIIVEQIGNSSVGGVIAREPSDKLRVVALATLSKHKGAEILGRLMRGVTRSDMEFHFHGRAAEGYDRQLAPRLQCHGSYQPSDIPRIMSEADIGVVLSIWEDNGPQTAMEFINYKVPVLGTKRGGIPDIVQPGSGVLFDPDIPGEVEGAITWLNTVTRQELESISESIKPLTTPEDHAIRISSIYSEIEERKTAQTLCDYREKLVVSPQVDDKRRVI